MKEFTKKLFAKAADTLEAADILLANGKAELPLDALITPCSM